MPNHCENKLTIVGSKEDLKAFKAKAVGEKPFFRDEEITETGEGFLKDLEDLSCNKFIPIPAKVLESFNDFGYKWCLKNWSTKWGCYDVDVFLRKNTLRYYFNSAWCPPEKVVVAMSKQHPGLRFRLEYWEGGVGFRGILICKAGKRLKDETYEYSGSRGG